MYVAVKGGEVAILQSHRRVDEQRRGDPALPELSVKQIRAQLPLAVDRVMSEGSLHDPELAALAIKQAAGDLTEAIFLVRAYRTTLPRLGTSRPLATSRMALDRRISAIFKDLPGGQLLGATRDYTQRMLDFSLLEEGVADGPASQADVHPDETIPTLLDFVSLLATPRAASLLADESLIEPSALGTLGDANTRDDEPVDLTREPLRFPATRSTRLQNLARADEGFLLAMAYSTQRGYAHTHPFAGELRLGAVAIELDCEELDFSLSIGEIEVTECEMVNQFAGSGAALPQFTRGYGLAFGHGERKAMAMSLVDRALRAEELGEAVTAPAQMPEFVLSHSDSLEASGFVSHLKLPHYVDFQSELDLIRRLRRERTDD